MFTEYSSLSSLTPSSILDLCDLVIEEKKYVWTLHADILCLNYDGNIYDSSTYALYGALKNTRLPAVKEDAQGELTYDYGTSSPLPSIPRELHPSVPP